MKDANRSDLGVTHDAPSGLTDLMHSPSRRDSDVLKRLGELGSIADASVHVSNLIIQHIQAHDGADDCPLDSLLQSVQDEIVARASTERDRLTNLRDETWRAVETKREKRESLARQYEGLKKQMDELKSDVGVREITFRPEDFSEGERQLFNELESRKQRLLGVRSLLRDLNDQIDRKIERETNKIRSINVPVLESEDKDLDDAITELETLKSAIDGGEKPMHLISRYTETGRVVDNAHVKNVLLRILYRRLCEIDPSTTSVPTIYEFDSDDFTENISSDSEVEFDYASKFLGLNKQRQPAKRVESEDDEDDLDSIVNDLLVVGDSITTMQESQSSSSRARDKSAKGGYNKTASLLRTGNSVAVQTSQKSKTLDYDDRYPDSGSSKDVERKKRLNRLKAIEKLKGEIRTELDLRVLGDDDFQINSLRKELVKGVEKEARCTEILLSKKKSFKRLFSGFNVKMATNSPVRKRKVASINLRTVTRTAVMTRKFLYIFSKNGKKCHRVVPLRGGRTSILKGNSRKFRTENIIEIHYSTNNRREEPLRISFKNASVFSSWLEDLIRFTTTSSQDQR